MKIGMVVSKVVDSGIRKEGDLEVCVFIEQHL